MVAQLTLGHRPQLRIAPGVLISGQLLRQNCTKHAFPSPANVFPSNPSACTWAGCPWNFHQLKWGCNFGEAILSTCCISRQQLMMLNYICLFCRQETVCSSVDSWSAVDSYINVQSWQEKADRNGQTCVRSSCLSARYNYASSIPSFHPRSHLCILGPKMTRCPFRRVTSRQSASLQLRIFDPAAFFPTWPRKATHLDCR